MKYGILAVVTLLLTASAGAACPFCESAIGEQVKAGIFNEDFGSNLVLTLLPFPVLLGMVALLHFGWPWSKAAAAQTGRTADTFPPLMASESAHE